MTEPIYDSRYYDATSPEPVSKCDIDREEYDCHECAYFDDCDFQFCERIEQYFHQFKAKTFDCAGDCKGCKCYDFIKKWEKGISIF